MARDVLRPVGSRTVRRQALQKRGVVQVTCPHCSKAFKLDEAGYADRVRAVYLHACLRYVEREFMTNTTLWERFGIDAKNSATASCLIKEALGAGVIRLQDPTAPPKTRRYLPSWA